MEQSSGTSNAEEYNEIPITREQTPQKRGRSLFVTFPVGSHSPGNRTVNELSGAKQSHKETKGVNSTRRSSQSARKRQRTRRRQSSTVTKCTSTDSGGITCHQHLDLLDSDVCHVTIANGLYSNYFFPSPSRTPERDPLNLMAYEQKKLVPSRI